MSEQWTQQEAIALCTELEAICPTFGCHIALTGGLLYKTGLRKDCDLIVYRIRQCSRIKLAELFEAIATLGIVSVRGFGWNYKATYNGKDIDFLIPEEKAATNKTDDDGEFYA